MIVLEAFESHSVMQPLTFYTYQLDAYSGMPLSYAQLTEVKACLKRQLPSDVFSPLIIASEKLWLQQPLLSIPPIAGLHLRFCGQEQADLKRHHQVYEQYIEQGIAYAVSQSHDAALVNPHSARTPQILEAGGVLKNSQGICYERQFYFKAFVQENGRVLLTCHFNGLFKSEQTIYALLCQGKQVENLLVHYDWLPYGGVGRITRVLSKTIADPEAICYKGRKLSLLDYYQEKGEGAWLQVLKAGDEAACMVEAVFKQKAYPFIPHALTPVITREALAAIDPDFSKALQPYMKLTMHQRFQVLQAFWQSLQQENWPLPLTFDCSCFAKTLPLAGYKEGCFEPPYLIGKTQSPSAYADPNKEKDRIFREGFYKECKRKYRLCLYYPAPLEEKAHAFGKALEQFARYGRWQGRRNTALAPCLLHQLLQENAWSYVPYDASQPIRLLDLSAESAGLAMIVIVPGQSEGLYEALKKEGAKRRWPSQMLTEATLHQILTGTAAGYYSLKNLILGLLTKTGGLPWVPAHMPGEADCFIGLDVGMLQPGRHQAACSLVFNESGEVLAYYKPSLLQAGEKITPEIMAELFAKTLHKYNVQYGHDPRHLVIHRDGFSNEDLDWYKSYLGKRGIRFDLLEIRKDCRLKLAEAMRSGYRNPKKGTYLMKDQLAYLITTQIDGRKGSGTPCALKIEKKYGPTDFKCLLEQVYVLAEMHVGAFQNTRLPITTAYADRMCQMMDAIPEGKVDNKLYFL